MNYRSEAYFEALDSEEAFLGEVQICPDTKFAAPTRDEIDELILQHRENARKLAYSLLRRWRVTTCHDDLNSLVDLTLCEAANRFSPLQGASFMTFMFYYMRGNLARMIAKMARSSKVFVIAGNDAINASIACANPQANASLSIASTDDFGHYDNQIIPDDIYERKERLTLCKQAAAELDPLEREVLERLYGQDETVVDIAKSLGYSRCHISRVKKTALDRFKSRYKSLTKLPSDEHECRQACDDKRTKRRIGRTKTTSRKGGGSKKIGSKAAASFSLA